VVFASTAQLKPAVAWFVRLALGPSEYLVRVTVAPYVTLIERAVYLVVTVALLAAAVNTVAATQADQSLLASEQEPSAAMPDQGSSSSM